MISAAEFTILCKTAGLTAAEIDDYNIGTILDYISIKTMPQHRKESRYSDNALYKALKEIRPQVERRFANGQITKEKYEQYLRQLREYEK